VKWKPFKLGETVFDLSHLDSFEFDVILRAKGEHPERCHKTAVDFSFHCFTKDFVAGDGYSAAYEYTDPRGDTRLFNIERYKLSKRLPGIIRGIHERSCFYTTKKRNLVLIDKDHYKDDPEPYWVFFWLSKPARGGPLALYVNSAYSPSGASDPRAKQKPASFFVILNKVVTGKPIYDR